MPRPIAFSGTILLLLLTILAPSAWAYREYFTAEQKAQLEKIQTVMVETIALTDKGAVDSGPITESVARRLGELGYTVVLDGAMREDLVYLSIARHLVRRSLGSFITAGATLKWARVGLETDGLSGIPGLRDSQSILTGDVGLLASPIPNVRLGVIARNLGQPQIDLVEGGDATALRSEIEWGVSLRWRQDAQLHLSQVTHPDHDTETKLGAEVDVLPLDDRRLGAEAP